MAYVSCYQGCGGENKNPAAATKNARNNLTTRSYELFLYPKTKLFRNQGSADFSGW